MKKLIFIIIILSLLNIANSQDDLYSSNSNIGIEFWFTIPPALEDISDNNNRVFVLVSPLMDSKIKLSIPGISYNNSKNAKKGEIAIFSLTPKQAQAYTKSGHDPVAESNVIGNAGIQLSSEHPAIVYVLVQYGNFSESFSPLPTSSLGKEYIIASYNDGSQLYPFYNSFPSLSGITAVYDNTIVEFTLPIGSDSKVAGNYQPGETITKILNKGDVWMISSREDRSDLSGSYIKSNLPVSVISGNQSANVPLLNKWNNYIVESEIPIHAWAYDYKIPTIRKKKYSPVIRIFAKNNNTEIFANGESIGSIDDNNVFLEYRFNNGSEASNGVISSDKPIRAVLYNAGIEEDASTLIEGSTFQMNLLPTDQFTNEIVLAIPSGTSKEFENYLTIIHEGENLGNDFQYKLINSNGNWQNLNSLFLDRKQIFAHSIESKIYTETRLLLPEIGVLQLKANTKFAAYLTGFNGKQSYGIPAATIVNNLLSLDTESPNPIWIQECDGSVDGIVTDKPNDDSRSNLTIPIFDSEYSYNYEKIFDEIIPGNTQSAKWKLTVKNTNEYAVARIIFRDLAGNDTTVIIEYNPIDLKFEPDRLNFGNVTLDDNQIKHTFLTNFSSQKIEIKQVFLAKNEGIFDVNFLENSFELNNQESKEFDVSIISDTQGHFSDTLIAIDNCGLQYKCVLEARIAAADIEVTDINFGKQVIETSTIYSAHIYNPSSVTLKISAFEGPESKVFKIKNIDIDSDSYLEIKPNEKYTFEVEFSPKDIGNYSDYIRFISNASDNSGVFDNVCFINAQAIEPGLSANSINWNKKRINRENYPSGPYPAPNSPGIILKNSGEIPITVIDIEYDDEKNVNDFQFNNSLFKNLQINPKDSTLIPVFYKPNQTGSHKLVINYVDNNFGKASTVLEGIGTAPKIKSSIVEFDNSIIGDINSPKLASLRIQNLSYSDWEFGDTLVIHDIRAKNLDEISFENDTFGALGFRVNKLDIDFPIYLEPGNFFDIPVEFVAFRTGEVSAELILISDALNDDAEFILKGKGIDKEIEITPGYGEACIGETIEIAAYVRNNGTYPINFSKISFKDQYESFRILDSDLANGFELLPFEEIPLKVSFFPKTIQSQTITLLLTDDGNSNDYNVDITGRTIQTVRKMNLSPINKSVEIGKTLSHDLIIAEGDEIKDFDIKNIDIIISYNGQMTQPIINSFRIGDKFKGIFALNKESIEQISRDEIRLNIYSIGGEVLQGFGTLISWDSDTYLPMDQSNTSEVLVSAYLPDTQCLVLDEAVATVKLIPVCADSLRRVFISDTEYSLNNIEYTDNNLRVNFDNGLESNTKIEIINSIGEIVSVPYNQITPIGNVELSRPIILTSGVYFCKITSGPYSTVRKILVLN